MSRGVGSLDLAGRGEASLRNVVALTGATRGSIYHHFPGGKGELVAEAMREVGGRLLLAMRASPAASPADVVVTFAGLFRRLVEVQSGCAVAAVASAGDDTRRAAAGVFASWRRELACMLTAAGVPPSGGTAWLPSRWPPWRVPSWSPGPPTTSASSTGWSPS